MLRKEDAPVEKPENGRPVVRILAAALFAMAQRRTRPDHDFPEARLMIG